MEEWNQKQALKREHFHILLGQEIYWKQHSRIQWLKEGGLNTSFFHKVVNSRRKKNSITSLFINGSWYDSPSLIRNTIKDHFYYLFNNLQAPGMSLNWNLLLPNKIPQPQDIEIPFSKEEIKRNAFSLLGDKSLGPDGFSLCFYHHFWNMMKGDMMDRFQFFHQ